MSDLASSLMGSEQPEVPQGKPTGRRVGGLAITRVEEAPDWMNILLYGDPGVGKTVLAGSASAVPDMNPVLVIDVEGGSMSLRSFYPDVDVVRCKSIPELVEVYTELDQGNLNYRTVVLDSLTEIQKMVMGDIMRLVVAEDADRDPDVPSIREWGKSGEQVRRIVRRFRDLPMHVIFTALLDEAEDKKGRKKGYPSLPGKGKREVAGFMDIVLFAYAKRVKLNAAGEQDDSAEASVHRFVLSSGTDEFTCKDRSARLPEVMLDPTMQAIHTLIKGT